MVQTSKNKRKGSKKARTKPLPQTEAIRLNRYMAQCGLCSRREADRWILDGRVEINGQKIEKPGISVLPSDKVRVDGKSARPAQHHTYIMYHKPRGLLCSRKDAKGRPLIYDHLDVAPNVQSVGRLDMDSEGLLLLTDDGDIARTLTRPDAHLPRKYRVRLTGELSLETLQALRQGGIDIDRDEVSDPWELYVDSESGNHTWITIVIHRGRWREVRRTLDACGHTVRRLIRIGFGSLVLGDIPAGAWREATASELRHLRQSTRQRGKSNRNHSSGNC